jgi:hypothetical protein
MHEAAPIERAYKPRRSQRSGKHVENMWWGGIGGESQAPESEISSSDCKTGLQRPSPSTGGEYLNRQS